MSNVVLTTFGSLGDLHPYVALARGLQARGHSVVVATHDAYRTRVEQAGIPFHPIGPDIADYGDESVFMARVMDPAKGPEIVIREMVMPHLERSYEDLDRIARDADMLVTHPLTFAAQLFAEKHARTLAWTSIVLAPSSFWSAYDPPVLAPLPWLAKLRPLGPAFFRPLMWTLEQGLRSWIKPWRAFREKLGLPPTARNPIFDGQFSPSLTLGLFSPLLGSPQPDWPPNAHVTGFPFYDGAGASDMPVDLISFLRNGEPPIVFTLGSSAVMDAGDFYQQSVEAAKRLKKRAVLLIGRDARNQPKAPLPDGVIACDYAPYSELLPRALATVHQGGVGTTAQALRAGKPMLVVPFGFDQPDNAARVEAIGVARVIPRKHYNADTVARALQLLIDTPRYGSRATKVGNLIAAENGIDRACVLLERQLDKRSSQSFAR